MSVNYPNKFSSLCTINKPDRFLPNYFNNLVAIRFVNSTKCTKLIRVVYRHSSQKIKNNLSKWNITAFKNPIDRREPLDYYIHKHSWGLELGMAESKIQQVVRVGLEPNQSCFFASPTLWPLSHVASSHSTRFTFHLFGVYFQVC